MPSLDAIKAAIVVLTEAVSAHEAEVAAEAARVPTLADVKALTARAE